MAEKDLAIKLKIEADGKDAASQISRVASEVGDLGKLAESADPDVARLAKELQHLIGESAKIEGFRALKKELTDTKGRLKDAQQAAQKLGKELAQTEGPTRAMESAFARARKEVSRLENEERSQAVALQKLRSELQQSGVATRNLAQANVQNRQEVAQTVAKLKELGAASSGISSGARDAGKKLKDVGDKAKTAGESAKKAGIGFSDLRGALATLAVAKLAGDFIELNSRLQSQQKALAQISGSTRAAAQDMAYLSGLSDRLGQSTLDLTDQYVQLAAATKGTALEGDATREVFESVVGAMAKLGKSSAETEQALVAISQMASKGVVSQEELRQQLGEALPGAMQALSRATGISVADLNKMIESGQLLASDVLPALAKGLNETYGDASVERIDTLSASVNRFQNAFSRAFTETGQNGLAEAFSGAIDGATGAMDGLVVGTVLLGKDIGALSAYVAGAIPSWDAFKDSIEENRQAAHDYVDGADKTAEATEKGAQAAQVQSKALQDLAASSLKATAAYTDADNAAKNTLKTTLAQGDAAKEAAKAELAKSEVLGNQINILKAKERLDKAFADAAKNEAEAAKNLAKVTQDRVLALQDEIVKIHEQVKADGLSEEKIRSLTDARQKQIEKLTQEGAVRDANAKKLAEEAAAQDLAAQKSRILAETYGDQSDQLQDLIAKRAELTKQLAEGLPVEDQVAELQIRIADAAKDAANAITLEIQSMSRQAALAEQSAQVQTEELKRRRDLALARGEEVDATRLSLRIRDAEIDSLEAAAEGKQRESDALERQAEMLRIAGEADGDYTDAERAQAEAVRDAAAMSELEAQKLAISAQAKRDAAKEAQRLAEQSASLSEAFGQVGVAGVETMDDVRRAIGAAADSEEVADLRRTLQHLFDEGILSSEEFQASLDQVKQKLADVEGAASDTRSVLISDEQLLAERKQVRSPHPTAPDAYTRSVQQSVIEHAGQLLREERAARRAAAESGSSAETQDSSTGLGASAQSAAPSKTVRLELVVNSGATSRTVSVDVPASQADDLMAAVNSARLASA